MKKLDLNKMARLDALDQSAFDAAYKQGLPHKMFADIRNSTSSACASILEEASKRGLSHIEYQFFPIKGKKGADDLAEMRMVAPLSIDESKIPDLRDLSTEEYGLEVDKWHKTKNGYELSVKIDWRAGTKNRDAIYLYEEFSEKFSHAGNAQHLKDALDKLASLAHVPESEVFRKMLSTVFTYYKDNPQK